MNDRGEVPAQFTQYQWPPHFARYPPYPLTGFQLSLGLSGAFSLVRYWFVTGKREEAPYNSSAFGDLRTGM